MKMSDTKNDKVGISPNYMILMIFGSFLRRHYNEGLQIFDKVNHTRKCELNKYQIC